MADIDQPRARSAAACMSSSPVSMEVLVSLLGLWSGEPQAFEGRPPSVVDGQSTDRLRVGNFNEQVWGDLRERDHASSCLEMLTENGGERRLSGSHLGLI